MSIPIYLDYNATAPLRPEALEIMKKVWQQPANPSSVHGFGRKARSYLETAREQVARLVSAPPASVIFTSGATESNNAVLSAFKNDTVWVSAIEHSSVLAMAPEAERIPVTPSGIIDMDAFETMLENGPAPDLISVMLVNNETGVIQPVEAIARMAKKRYPQVHVHTDAAQAAGRIPVNFQALQVDYMSLSAHKLGGPQGVGALIKAPGAHDVKFLHGGGQERNQRAGTVNTAGIAGFGIAAEIARDNMDEFKRLETLRNRLEASLKEEVPEVKIYGQDAPRVSNTIAICVPGLTANTQIIALDMEGVAVSGGSACSSGTTKKSHVAEAMGVPKEEIAGAYRISMGPHITDKDIDAFLSIWSKIVSRMKKQN